MAVIQPATADTRQGKKEIRKKKKKPQDGNIILGCQKSEATKGGTSPVTFKNQRGCF